MNHAAMHPAATNPACPGRLSILRRLTVAFTLLIVAGLSAACDTVVSPHGEAEQEPVLVPAAAEAAAGSGAEVLRGPVVSFFYASCIPDFIKLEGEGQFVRRTGTSGGNDGVHFIDRTRYIYRGTGLLTGATYQVQSITTHAQENLRLPYGSTSSYASHLRFVQHGGGLAFRVRSMIHVTVDANGEIAVEMTDHTVDCGS